MLLRNALWDEQPLRAADKRVAAFVETQLPISRSSNADAHRFSDAPGWLCHFAKPQRAGPAEIQSVVRAVNLKGGSEPAWSASQIEKPSRVAIPLHQLNAFEWLHPANENCRRNSRRLAYDIQHKVRAIIEKNVCVALRQVHRSYSRSRTVEVVARGIARRISFGFHNASAHASIRKIMNDYFSD